MERVGGPHSARGCRTRLAKAASEGDEFVVVEFLAAYQQHQIVKKRAMHRFECAVVQHAYVAAAHFGADLRVERDDFDGVARYSLRCHDIYSLNSVEGANGVIVVPVRKNTHKVSHPEHHPGKKG